MDNEIIFLKYLDDQLGESEAGEVEKMISNDQQQKEIFDAVKQKRQATLDALEALNPTEKVIVPDFKFPGKKSKALTFWRYAAAVAILIALPASYWWFSNKSQDELLVQQTEITRAEEMVSDTEELDCYISPNRCWNHRQLVWTVIELND
jgi:hypothetical protein